jgi:hypothetical protein
VIRLNNQGQAYSTFKLLIAAIVALAILMILMPIIASVLQIFQNDPADKTIELLNDLYNKPESIKITQMPVTFTPNMVLSADALKESTSLSANNICMSLGEFEEDEDGFSIRVEDDIHHRITWNGQSNQNTKIAVTCNINLDRLESGIEDTKFEDWDPDCGICEDNGRCCIVALVNP